MKDPVEECFATIASTDCFLSIYIKEYERDPKCLFELGVAIVLDKPIGLIVPYGGEIPGHLKKIAKAIEYYDPNSEKNDKDLERITSALMKKMDV